MVIGRPCSITHRRSPKRRLRLFYVAAALHQAARGLVSLPDAVLARAIAACRKALDANGTYTGVTADVLPSWDIKTLSIAPPSPPFGHRERRCGPSLR